MGTSDATILEYGDGVFEVLATAGDALLGGDDIDEALMQYVAEDFKKQNGVDLLADNTAKSPAQKMIWLHWCTILHDTL